MKTGAALLSRRTSGHSKAKMSQKPHKKITIFERSTKYSKRRRLPRKETITREINARIVEETIEKYGSKAKAKLKEANRKKEKR